MDVDQMRLPEGADRGVAGEAMRRHAAAVHAQGFHHAVAEAGTAHTRLQPNGAPASGPAPAALIPPISNAYSSGYPQPIKIAEADLGGIANAVAHQLAEANEQVARITNESDGLKARRDELVHELEAEQRHAAAASIAGARALLEGDQAQRAKRAERRSRAEAAVRELTTAIKIAEQRIEALRIESHSADERRAVWAGAAEDLAVCQAAPALVAMMNEMIVALGQLDASRCAMMSNFLSGSIAGKGAVELRRYLDGLARRLGNLVSPPTPVTKVFAAADTAIALNRGVSYQQDANSTVSLRAGSIALVPAHIAHRLVVVGAGTMPSQPSKIEIRTLVDLQVGDGSVPRGHCAWVAKAVADEVCAARKAERTGLFEFAPGSEPVATNSRMPELALGYVALPQSATAKEAEA